MGATSDWADDRLWLLFEPRTIVINDSETISMNRAAITDFSRERTVRRYNKRLNEIIQFWAKTLYAGGKSMMALGVTTGVDATFQMAHVTAFSKRWAG